MIGAGVAGAALVRALHRLGCNPMVIEAAQPGAGASGNPVALVTPRPDAGLGRAAELHAQAFARATDLYARETPEAVVAQGALQLNRAPKDTERFAKIAAWPGFASGGLSPLTSAQAAERLAEPGAGAALAYDRALVVEPGAVLKTWLGDAAIVHGRVCALEASEGVWQVLDKHGVVLAEADVVVLAAGPVTAHLAPSGAHALPLQPVRGQASWTEAPMFKGLAAAWGGYALPLRNGGVLFGAAHARGDWDTAHRPGDEAHNMELLAQGRPALAAELAGRETQLRGRASLRAATPDHLPLAGRWTEGLYVLSGLGGRGFTLAPLLAEHVAALVVGAPSPLPRALAAIVDPERYADAKSHAPARPSLTDGPPAPDRDGRPSPERSPASRPTRRR